MRALGMLLASMLLLASTATALAARPTPTVSASACRTSDAIVFTASWSRSLNPSSVTARIGESLEANWTTYDPYAPRPTGTTTTFAVPMTWVTETGYPNAWVVAYYHGFHVTLSQQFTISALPACAA